MVNYSLVRKALTAVALAAIAVAAAGAQTPPPSQTPPAPQKTPAPTPAPSIVGKWSATLEAEAITATPTLEFFQQGDKLTGTYESTRYGKFPFTATLKGKMLEFAFTMSVEGTDVPMVFKGEVAPDFKLMKGTAEVAGMGSATWTAKRIEK